MGSAPQALSGAQGRPIVLGNELGHGGEAAVFEVQGLPGRVAKIYMPPKSSEYAGKLDAMVAFGNERLLKLAAWPTEVVFGRSGSAAGFLMPKVSGFRPAFELYGPKLRIKTFPKADWRFLIAAAANTARSFKVVHDIGHVIGDVNHGNLLIGQDATVRLIDCDSFQITQAKKTWFCEVGVPTHQPPEMQGMLTYKGFTRTTNHDGFGLAVLIFQLLCLARHPYSGVFIGAGDAPSMEDAIRSFRYAYTDSRLTQMSAPPGSLPMRALTPQITQLFERAFLRGSEQAGARPTPDQWVSALDGMAMELRQCSVVPSHYYVSSNAKCPWCALEVQTKFQIFPVVFVPGSTGADGFMLLWQQVVATHVPGPRNRMPDPPAATASEEAQHVGSDTKLLYGVIFCLFVVAFFVIRNYVPAPASGAASLGAALIACVLALFACFMNGGEFRKRLKSASRDWRELQADWIKAAARSPAVVRAELDDLKRSYDVVEQDRVTKLSKLHNERQASQLADWLDTFRIDGAGVRGVGQAKAATLQSYGIETAGDVVYHQILKVSGFGPKTAQNLLDWRTSKERQFKFDPSKGIAPVDLAKVENAAMADRRLLHAKLSVGFQELKTTIIQELTTVTALRARHVQTAPTYAQADANAKAAFLLFAG